MAGDWLPMRLDLHEDPAVIYIADQMDTREEHVVGYLHRLWSWASRHMSQEIVTGVTLSSLGRVTNLRGFPELVRDAGWLEETEVDGRPAVRFPKFERWLSESAKKRLNAAQRKRESRTSHSDVTKKCDKRGTKSVTTEQNRTEQVTHTHKGAEGFEEEWTRWLDYREAVDGRKPDPIQQDAVLMDLQRRGAEKAKADIAFSLRVGAKSIRDSDNDYDKRQQSSGGQRQRKRLDL